ADNAITDLPIEVHGLGPLDPVGTWPVRPVHDVSHALCGSFGNWPRTPTFGFGVAGHAHAEMAILPRDVVAVDAEQILDEVEHGLGLLLGRNDWCPMGECLELDFKPERKLWLRVSPVSRLTDFLGNV